MRTATSRPRYSAVLVLLALPGLSAAPGSADTAGGGSSPGLAELLGSGDSAGFEKALVPRPFVFPDDHGPHPGFRNEWWYFTGNLVAMPEGDRRFGFELTIFRFQLTPEPVSSLSAWRTNQVYIAHFAVTDAERGRFFTAQRSSRGAAGLAGAVTEPLRVWVYDWEIAATDAGREWRLGASADDFSIELVLDPLKPPVPNGDAGLSQKSDEPGNASYYYSMPRWRAGGRVTIEGEAFDVGGSAWLDREWSSSALGPAQQGWDWFALQLDDGSELMFYNLRRRDGSRDRHSAGTWIPAGGTATHLDADDVTITVTDRWENPEGARYPSGWRLEVPGLGLALDVEPVIDNQELVTLVRYWEGAVDVGGTHRGRPVSGVGYVELTGYAD